MKSESEAQKTDEKGGQPTHAKVSSKEVKASEEAKVETKAASKDANAKGTAQQPKRIRYTKQEMIALAKERVSLQRPPNLPQEPIFRRHRDNTSSNSSSSASNNATKEKPVEKEREAKESNNNKPAERPPPAKAAEAPKPRKDRYGTPSWFTEEINSSEAFQFGTLDREADKAQMAKAAKATTTTTMAAAKPDSEVEEEEEEEENDQAMGEASEPTEPTVTLKLASISSEPPPKPAATSRSQSSEQQPPMKLAATSRSQSSEAQPPTEPELLPLERLGIRDPSRESSQGKEHSPWNSTWPSLFGSFFSGFSNEPPRHDPWSSPTAEAPKPFSPNLPPSTLPTAPPSSLAPPSLAPPSFAPPSSAPSASHQTAALKNLLRIGGGTKPVVETHLQAANAEWSSRAPAPSLNDGWPKQEQDVLHKIPPSNWSHQDNHNNNNNVRGWSDNPAPRDPEWREGISGWQQQEVGWPEQTKPRVEWVSRDPRDVHHGEDMFKGHDSHSAPSSSSTINAFSANAATVAKRSSLSVQALLSMNLPNRNPMPHNAVLVSTLENRQLVRAAAERDKAARPTVSFTPCPAETYATSPRLDHQPDPMAEHIARMVSKAHLRKATAPLASGSPTATFSSRQSPQMRYAQNQFASAARQPSGYMEQQKALSPQMFYQQNSPHSLLPNPQQPNLAALPPSRAARPNFAGGVVPPPSANGNAGLEKWFEHMLQKPNSH